MAAQTIDPVKRNIGRNPEQRPSGCLQETVAPIRQNARYLEGFSQAGFQGQEIYHQCEAKIFCGACAYVGSGKTLDFAKKVAAQKPIWMKSDARIITSLLAGEYPLFLGSNYKTFMRMQAKDPKEILGFKALEPIPIRLSETEGVLATAANPHAGLLWLEFIVGPEGQKILDDVDLSASLYNTGSAHDRLTWGKKVSLVAWEYYLRVEGYEEQIVKALGFPRADK